MAVKESLTTVKVDDQPIVQMDSSIDNPENVSGTYIRGGFADIVDDSWQIIMPKEVGDGEYELASDDFLDALDAAEEAAEDDTEAKEVDTDTKVDAKTRRSLGKKALALVPGLVAVGAVTAAAVGPQATTIADNIGHIIRHENI